jgi:hypothetical protein
MAVDQGAGRATQRAVVTMANPGTVSRTAPSAASTGSVRCDETLRSKTNTVLWMAVAITLVPLIPYALGARPGNRAGPRSAPDSQNKAT